MKKHISNPRLLEPEIEMLSKQILDTENLLTLMQENMVKILDDFNLYRKVYVKEVKERIKARNTVGERWERLSPFTLFIGIKKHKSITRNLKRWNVKKRHEIELFVARGIARSKSKSRFQIPRMPYLDKRLRFKLNHVIFSSVSEQPLECRDDITVFVEDINCLTDRYEDVYDIYLKQLRVYHDLYDLVYV